MKNKFKIGDKVKVKLVRYGTTPFTQDEIGITQSMEEYVGMEAVIVSHTALWRVNNPSDYFKLDVDNKEWNWYKDWLGIANKWEDICI